MWVTRVARNTCIAATWVVWVTNCAPTPDTWRSQAPRQDAARSAPRALAPIATGPAHWVLIPDGVEAGYTLHLPSGARASLVDGVRIEEASDGTLLTAKDRLPANAGTPTFIPERLGGGFLFTAENAGETALFRATTWTGPLTPWIRVSDRMSDLVVGLDRVYFQRAQSHELIGIDARDGSVSDLGPLPDSSAYSALAFVDAWFGAVATDVQGLLVTFDAGDTWQTTGIRDSGVSLRVEDGALLVTAGSTVRSIDRHGVIRVQPDTSVERALVPASHSAFGVPVAETPLGQPHPLGLYPIQAAVAHGWPTAGGTALVAMGGALGEVRLADGHVERVRRDAFIGSAACDAVSLGAGVGFVCSEPRHGTQIYQYEEPLTLRRVVEFDSARAVSSGENGALTVRGPCRAAHLDGASSAENSEQTYCIVYPPESPREVRVRGDIGAERMLTLRDGRIAVVIPPRFGSPGQLTLIDADKSHTIELKLPPSPSELVDLLSNGLWLNSFTELPQGPAQLQESAQDKPVLATWVASADRFIGIQLGLDGKVIPGKVKQGDLRRTVLGGPRALELSAGGVAWQTTDYGFHWSELILPRGLGPVTSTDIPSVPEQTPLDFGCSLVGCSYGSWLRVGYEPLPSSTEAAAETGVRDLREADSPARILDNPVQYSDWSLHCYPTGERRFGSNSPTSQPRTARAQRGLVAGFKTSALSGPTQSADIDSTANRPFLGVSRPSTPPGFFAFDMGADSESQFRAYAWGASGEAWRRTSAWLVRTADRFDLDSVWSTATTETPWIDFITAAQTFGADRANRQVTAWQYEAEPSDRGGVLKIATGTTSELHFIEQGAPIVSLSGVQTGAVDGVVKVEGQWYFGAHEGAVFHIYQAGSHGATRIAEYPVNATTSAQLIRDTESTTLALLVRTRRGVLYVYPLPDVAAPQDPLVYGRAELNREWSACEEERQGWVIQSTLPLSRSGHSDLSSLLEFEGDAVEWRAQSVVARVILRAGGSCVDALAAQVASTHPAGTTLPRMLPKTSPSIPLTLTDRATDYRYGFRCVP